MIAYHFMEAIKQSGVIAPEKVWYGTLPLGKQDVVMVVERGGQYNKHTCIHTALIDVYGRFCSPSELHRTLYDINTYLSEVCNNLPEVADACCKDVEFYNEHRYKASVTTINAYEDLGEDSSETRLARWSYQITFTKE